MRCSPRRESCGIWLESKAAGPGRGERGPKARPETQRLSRARGARWRGAASGACRRSLRYCACYSASSSTRRSACARWSATRRPSSCARRSRCPRHPCSTTPSSCTSAWAACWGASGRPPTRTSSPASLCGCSLKWSPTSSHRRRRRLVRPSPCRAAVPPRVACWV